MISYNACLIRLDVKPYLHSSHKNSFSIIIKTSVVPDISCCLNEFSTWIVWHVFSSENVLVLLAATVNNLAGWGKARSPAVRCSSERQQRIVYCAFENSASLVWVSVVFKFWGCILWAGTLYQLDLKFCSLTSRVHYILMHSLSHTIDTLRSSLLFTVWLTFSFVPRKFSASFVWNSFWAKITFFNIYFIFSNFLTLPLLHLMVLGAIKTPQFIIFCKSINQR